MESFKFESVLALQQKRVIGQNVLMKTAFKP